MLAAILSSSRLVRVWTTVGLGFTGLAMAAGLQLSAPPESEVYQRVVLTRDYWFLSQWHWYEWIGLIAPMLILSGVAMAKRRDGDAARVGLARMAVAVGTIALAVAILFARTGMATHLVARMQPLRPFNWCVLMTWARCGFGRAIAATAANALGYLRLRCWRVMVAAERRTFPLKHLGARRPGSGDADSAREASLKRRSMDQQEHAKGRNLAMDAQYITKPGEDAQGCGDCRPECAAVIRRTVGGDQ
jgi:hypothetical protein